MVDDASDYDDHDFNQPGYKLCVSGYMSLEFDDNVPIDVQTTSDDIFTEVDFNINEDPFENFLRKKENEDIKALINDIIHTAETSAKAIPCAEGDDVPTGYGARYFRYSIDFERA